MIAIKFTTKIAVGLTCKYLTITAFPLLAPCAIALTGLGENEKEGLGDAYFQRRGKQKDVDPRIENGGLQLSPNVNLGPSPPDFHDAVDSRALASPVRISLKSPGASSSADAAGRHGRGPLHFSRR